MKISVITPSFNQGEFIERTIESVLAQRGAFELQYIVVDGLSTDGTPGILARYADRVEVVAEKDAGQSDAINKGFRRATGDVLAWLNSDDTYEPCALAAVAEAYSRKPFAWCFGNCRVIDENDRELRRFITDYKIAQSRRYSFRRLLRRNFVSQPATFYAHTAIDAVGELDTSLVYSMDYDYFLRLAAKYEPRYIDRYLANFRWHSRSKSGKEFSRTAWVAYECAKKHAPAGSGFDLFMHRLHYHALSIVYRML